jgi:predicted dehydrogenase
VSEALRVAIVGCGQFAEEHVRQLESIAGARVVAVIDTEELLAEQLAERYAIPRYYGSLESMYEDQVPDVVHITTPPHTHLPIGRIALGQGSHVYVEKPFAIDAHEAAELIALSQDARRKVTVGHIYQFDPAAQRARELVARGTVGRPMHLEALLGYGLEGTFGRAFIDNPDHWLHRLPGKLFHNVISHLVARIAEFIEDETPDVQVFSRRQSAVLVDKNVAVPDELRVMVAGTRITAYLTFSAGLGSNYSLFRIYGDKNTVEVDLTNSVVLVRRGQQLPTVIGQLIANADYIWQYNRGLWRNLARFAAGDAHYWVGLNHLLKAFYGSIRDDGPVPIPYPEILRTARIMDLIFERLPR